MTFNLSYCFKSHPRGLQLLDSVTVVVNTSLTSMGLALRGCRVVLLLRKEKETHEFLLFKRRGPAGSLIPAGFHYFLNSSQFSGSSHLSGISIFRKRKQGTLFSYSSMCYIFCQVQDALEQRRPLGVKQQYKFN